MARLIDQRALPTPRFTTTFDPGWLLLTAVQLAVLGGIAVFIVMAIINTVLGTPAQEPTYAPYG